MIPLKSEDELELMKTAGKILARIMRLLVKEVKEGKTTQDLDTLAFDLMQQEGVVAAFKGYRGFPAAICASVNEEIVHGIPGPRVLLDGDILSLDVGISYKGYFSDSAITCPVGRIDAEKKKLIDVTRKSLSEGIKKARVQNKLSDISYAIQSYVEINGFSVVRDFVGHGIGSKLHEDPEIPNYGRPGQGPILKAGMVLAIEPMINIGTWETEILDNGWTAVTKDGLASAHFEHTVAITESGPIILTN